jgi:hypothetical protein
MSGVACVRRQPARVAEMIGHVQGLMAGELLQVASIPEPSQLVAAVATEALITSTAEEERHAAAGAQNGHHAAGSRGSSSSGAGPSQQQQQAGLGAAAAAAAALLDVSREQLHDQLAPLVIGLYRSEQLAHVLLQYK